MTEVKEVAVVRNGRFITWPSLWAVVGGLVGGYVTSLTILYALHISNIHPNSIGREEFIEYKTAIDNTHKISNENLRERIQKLESRQDKMYSDFYRTRIPSVNPQTKN